ncbi:spore coat protein [Paenibacillus hamazuiensis]|uniref:spore coat protein n=1 Tax=Paenibacillus hamazuiensis TaxID=2936508 RepID=UPI00200F7E47|nr:spore coat protein [Paenibacillus hamazuiensis]
MSMPFGAHETMEVHEVLNEKLNLINHFALYAQFAQNEQIRSMIDRHLQTAVAAYDQLVAYTHDYSAANRQLPPYRDMTAFMHPQQIQYGLHHPMPVAPEMQGRLNDPQILCAMLSCHKNSAKLHMQGALECADPNVRQMLVNGALACANQAYEVFLLMNQQGLYQVPTMNDHTAKTFLHSYQPMQPQSYPQAFMQHGGMQTGTMQGMRSGMMQPGATAAYQQ